MHSHELKIVIYKRVRDNRHGLFLIFVYTLFNLKASILQLQEHVLYPDALLTTLPVEWY